MNKTTTGIGAPTISKHIVKNIEKARTIDPKTL